MLQEEHCPIIVDDTYDLAETATLSFGGEHREGLLADGDFPAALLSMSGYGKSPVQNGKLYQSTWDYFPLVEAVAPPF